jgi:hypothetical protein
VFRPETSQEGLVVGCRPETSREGLVAGCRPGFMRHVEHTHGSDGERGQALPGIRSGRGDWSRRAEQGSGGSSRAPGAAARLGKRAGD